MDEYRRPFIDEMARLPTLVWPRQLPIDNEPLDVCEVVERYSQVLGKNDVPKLFINADPGVIVTSRIKEVVRRWPNQTEVTVKGFTLSKRIRLMKFQVQFLTGYKEFQFKV